MDKVVRFPAERARVPKLALQRAVPDTVVELQGADLQRCSTFEKALIGVVYTLRNLKAGKISLAQAESEAAEIMAILEDGFSPSDKAF